MPPLSLTDEEMALLRELSAPIPLRQRQEFLLAIVAELESEQGAGADIGPGLIHRVASRLQHRFGPAPQCDRARHGPSLPARPQRSHSILTTSKGN
jgi:hypothetical protein